ncbi:MAG: ABC transporter ATP-binding protein [Planctomycetota bacterium]|nr:MAG: ABC transporter ATP-binding protein [Planctomycetota bacterium]
MIEVRGLKKRFGPVEAVRGVDLSVRPGECFGLIGPNGAGKTTTLKTLATLVKPDRGQVIVGGLDAVEHAARVRRLVGYMPDVFQSYGDLKVIHYLDYYAALVGLRGSERVRQVEEVLELVDLGPKRSALVGGLSRGVKQRLCLAKTLLHDPKVLLLDEPASGLDPRARIEIRLLLKVLRAEMGKTIVISSHILEDLEEICSRVAVIEAGRVVASGDVAELKAAASGVVRYLLEPAGDPERARAALARSPLIEEVVLDEGRLRIAPAAQAENELDVLELLVAEGIRVRSFREEVPDLHEVFLSLTSGEVA